MRRSMMHHVARTLVSAASTLVSTLGAVRKGRCRIYEMQYLAILAVALVSTNVAVAQQRTIDTGKSTMTVRVYKSGVLSAFGHDHEIAAPISAGSVDPTAHKVELHAKASSLRVNDPGVSEKDRTEIQNNMLGADVLDAEHSPEIVFRSTTVEPAGEGVWKVHGSLTLRGQSQPVDLDVHEASGHYTGASRLKLSSFGIKQIKAAGGTVKVKDEIRIEFDIQLAH